jgi:hypothetical protein
MKLTGIYLFICIIINYLLTKFSTLTEVNEEIVTQRRKYFMPENHFLVKKEWHINSTLKGNTGLSLIEF